jgi:putative ABC transport system permease protein
MRIALPDTAYKTPSRIRSLFDRLLAQLSALPGVRQVGAISDLPMESTTNSVFSVEGLGSDNVRADTLFCLGDALASLRVPLLRGRMLQPGDYTGKPHVAVISEGLAKQIWPRGNPIGGHIKFGVDDPLNDEPWLTVVGVVADIKSKLTSKAPRMAVFTTPPDWVNEMNVLIRTSANPLSLASTIRRQVHQIDPNLPVGAIKPVDQILDESLSAERFRTWLLASFAIAAVLLATLGIAGLLAYNAAQRMREFGVRVALGANRRNLLGSVFRHSLWLSSVGVAVGLVASLIATRTLSALLYDTSPFDPTTFIAVSLILTLVALAAALIPAWRVIHVDPAISLRAE